ncbi:MAG TPA: methyltransferase domain-containing protein, partial [Waddliaceae bacterium]
IREAKELTSKKGRHFYVGDVTKTLNLPLKKADIVAMILAIQDLNDPEGAIVQASQYLETGGQFLIVMNHPCFRIPRQSEWGVDEAKKLQYRRINGYLRSNTIPIQTSPGRGESSPTVLYSHHPLKDYSKWLKDHGFVIELLDEWASEKKSEGPKKKMEDRARAEFPLFLCILARKL